MSSPVHLDRRQFGLPTAIAIVVGESIALGIFLTPATMAKSLGSPLLLALVWMGMTLMAMCGALCYSELAIRFPESGGDYVYLRAGYGDRIAFLYGWMSSIVMYPGVAAALAVGASAYVAQVLPLDQRAMAFVPATILCIFGAVNFVGTKLSGSLMTFINIFKLAILFALLGWAVISGHARLDNLTPLVERRPGSEPLIPALSGAMISAFFCFGGWWEASKIAGEVRHPRRTLPLALLGGVALVTVIYLLISAAFLAVLPIERITSNTAFVAQFGEALFATAGAKILSLCVLICVFGGLAALTMASPRVTFAMAQTGTFFSPFGKMHSRFGTPANAILLQTFLSLGVLFLGAFDRVLAYIIFSAVLFLALTASSLFRLSQPVRAWWFPAAPIVFIALSIAVSLLILMHNPLPALVGVGIVLCGLPLHYVLTARQIQAPIPNEGS
ncbi:MAG: amino acid permease [Terracidiphilus sp.]|nr:amino acid permease [Terracidiphilus sp.]